MTQAPFVSSRSARKKLDAFADATLAQAQMWPQLQAVVDNHAASLVELQERNLVNERALKELCSELSQRLTALEASLWLRLRWLVTGR